MTGLDRLKEIAKSTNDFVISRCIALEMEIAGICDQIEREHLREVDDVSGRDADILAWVEEHGGLAEVREYYECGRRIEPWNEQKADLYELMNACGGVEEIKKRLMPAGMELPRFDDWEPVRPGDEFADGLGGARVCTSVEFLACEEGVRDVLIHWDGDDPDNAMLVCMASGERVKRPAPKVLDSEGVECNVGDAVWWVRNKTGDFRIIRIEQDGKCAIHDDDADEPCGMTVPSTELTHRRPMFDADGVEIRVGDTVYLLPGEWCDRFPLLRCHEWDAMKALDLSPNHTTGRIECATSSSFVVCYPYPSQLTHRAPVLAADGRPLREGEEVYKVGGDGTAYVFDGMSDNVDGLAMLHHDDKPCIGTGLRVDQLTHEQPDSWERLEEDAGKNPFDYCKDVGHRLDTCENSEAYKARDLVRRAKKLAGVER